MEVVHERAAGIDISKRDAKIAVRVPGKRAGTYTTSVSTWGATVPEILELVEFLAGQQVTVVVMEATSDYWKPFYFLMEDRLPVMLVNARQARNIPGRKTDVSDAAWLAQLAAHGLLRASFVPPEPVRQLRDLTRARAMMVRDRTRQFQRLEKFLESTGMKLSAVLSKLSGMSARLILDALVAGERDPRVLAELARGKARAKIPELVEALQGRFTEHHAFMVAGYLAQIDTQTAMIDRFTERIEDAIEPFRAARDALTTIPGVSNDVADVIIAETGGDMTVFETAGHLASWAGVCPGHNESAGRRKSSHTREGNKHLKAALGIAALSASRSKGTFIRARYQRILARRGKLRAVVAIEHTILTATWNMLQHGLAYQDPGGDYYARREPERTRERAIHQLRNLGYNVTITPVAA